MQSFMSRSALGRRVASVAVVGLAATTLSFGTAGPASAAGPTDLEGTVTGVGGVPVQDVNVTAYDASGTDVDWATTDASGHYQLDDLTGAVKLRFQHNPVSVTYTSPLPYTIRWSGNTRSLGSAESVEVTADPVTPATYDFALSEKYGAITGTLTLDGRPLSDPNLDWDVEAYNADSDDVARWGGSDATSYRVFVPAGSYRTSFEGWDYSTPSTTYFLRKWWKDGDALESATPITVAAGQTVGGINMALTKTLVARSAPQILGTPAVGRTLTAVPGTWSKTATTDYSYTWKRGVTVVGTGPNYTPTVADFGSALTLTVAATSNQWDHYTNTGQASVVSDVVRYAADSRGKAKALDGRKVRFGVKVVSAKQSPVKGKVVVMRGSKVVHKAVKLVKGKAVIVIKGQPKGKQTYTVVYKGNSLLSTATKTFTVRVHS